MEHVDTQFKEDVTKNENTRPARLLFNGKFILVFVFLIAIVVILIGFKTYQQQHKQQVKTITVTKQVLQKRSKDIGFVQRALTGKAVDVNTGKIIQAARIFTLDDKTVYLELDLDKAPKGTLIDYIRYKGGRYVDHGEIKITKANTSNVLFSWIIAKLLGTSHDGKWKIATYTNGILAKRVTYEIKGNKVSSVQYDEPLSQKDPEYRLSSALSLAK